jgi:hypothetical protein
MVMYGMTSALNPGWADYMDETPHVEVVPRREFDKNGNKIRYTSTGKRKSKKRKR